MGVQLLTCKGCSLRFRGTTQKLCKTCAKARYALRLWVVEILFADDPGAGWQPTKGVALSREDARREITRWIEANPEDQFRVVEYRRHES